MSVNHFEASRQESVHMQSQMSLMSTANTAKHPKQNRKTEVNKVTKTEAKGGVSHCCRELRASTRLKTGAELALHLLKQVILWYCQSSVVC